MTHRRQWSNVLETASLQKLLSKVPNEQSRELISRIDSAVHGDCLKIGQTRQQYANCLSRLASTVYADASKELIATAEEWASFRVLSRNPEYNGESECMFRLFDAIDDFIKELRAWRMAELGAGSLEEIHRRYTESPNEIHGRALIRIIQNCSELDQLAKFCAYFLDFLRMRFEYRWPTPGLDQDLPHEYNLTGHDTAIFWLLTKKLGTEIIGLSSWIDKCDNDRMASYVLWPWLIEFGSTADALWAADKRGHSEWWDASCLFGLVGRVERSQTTVTELMPKINEWSCTQESMALREQVAGSLGSLYHCRNTCPEEKEELQILLSTMWDQHKDDQEGNATILNLLTLSMQKMADLI